MAHPRLRVYYGPDDSACVQPTVSDNDTRVTVKLAEVADWLADATRSGRAWLRDFEDEELSISADLHDVIQAYQKYRRPGA